MAQEKREETTYEVQQRIQAEYEADPTTKLGKIVALNTERLEILYGDRNAKPETMKKCAVRAGDLSSLLEFPYAMQAQWTLSASPSAAEYNALITDVLTIYDTLAIISEALRQRVRPATKDNPK